MTSSLKQLAIDKDYRCGYCFQPRDGLIDPRILPCNHVFCYSCVSNDYRNGSTLDCPICRVKHTDLEIRGLPSYQFDRTDTCSICQENAELCCNQCSINLCASHAKEHDESFALSSKFLKHQQAEVISSNSKAFNKEDKTFCTVHPKEEVRWACVECFKALCAECAITSICSGDKCHNAERIDSLSAKLKKDLALIMDDLHAKSAILSDMEKEANITLAKKQEAVEEMKSLVDKVTLEQISEIQENSRKINALIDDTFQSMTQTVENYCGELLAKKESTEDVIKEIFGLVNLRSNFDITQNFKRVIEEAEKQNDGFPTELSLPFIAIKQLGKQRESEVEISLIQEKLAISSSQSVFSGRQGKKISIPKCLKYVCCIANSFHIVPMYNSVEWLSNSSIACGGAGFLQILDENLKVKHECQIAGTVGSICRYDGDFLVLIHSTDDGYTGCRIDRFSIDFNYLSTTVLGLDDLVDTYAPYMAVIQKNILIADLENECFKLYNMERDHVMDISFEPYISSVAGLRGLEGNSFLVSDDVGGRVAKFRLEPNSRPVWICRLFKPTSVSIDSAGFIYVTSNGLATVYLLNPSGKWLKQFSISNWCSDRQCIAVFGNDVAVASNDDVHYFQLVY